MSRTQKIEQISIPRKEDSDDGFWYRCCCADCWLHHTTMQNIDNHADRVTYQSLNTPFIEASLLMLLIVEILLSLADLCLEQLIQQARFEMKATFCGFGDPNLESTIFCYGTGDAYNTSSSTYYVDRIDKLKHEIHLMQILSLVTVLFSIVAIILFNAESFRFIYYLGYDFCKYPILVFDFIFALSSLACLLVDLDYAMSFCESNISLANNYYSNYFNDYSEEATSCITPNVTYKTNDIDQPYACDNQTTSTYVKHAGRLLLMFRLWRVVRVFKSIFEHQDKKSKFEAFHASAMAGFIAKNALMLRQKREKDNAYLSQILGTGWNVLIGVVRGNRFKNYTKTETHSGKLFNTTSEPAIGASYEGVIHGIGSSFKNTLTELSSSRRHRRKRSSAGHKSSGMSHDIQVVVKTVRNDHENWYDEKTYKKYKTKTFGLKDMATVDIASVLAIRNISLHDHMVKMHGVCGVDRSPHVHLVTEFLEGTGSGRSMHYFMHHKSSDFNELQIMQIACDISEGLKYLHNIGMIHGNLCPSNILLVAPTETDLQNQSPSSRDSSVANNLSRDDLVRCRAAFKAVVGANATHIDMKDFHLAARAVGCTELEVERIIFSRSAEFIRETRGENVLFTFEEFVALTTIPKLRNSMYRAKLADPWFYRLVSKRPFRVGDRVEVVESLDSNAGAIGTILSLMKKKAGSKGAIIVDLGEGIIESFEPQSLSIVSDAVGPIGILDENRRRTITHKWTEMIDRDLESPEAYSRANTMARQHAKVLCQRKCFEKSMFKSPESSTLGFDFRNTLSRDADVYAFAATIYAVMMRQGFDTSIDSNRSESSGMKRFRALLMKNHSLDDNEQVKRHHSSFKSMFSFGNISSPPRPTRRYRLSSSPSTRSLLDILSDNDKNEQALCDNGTVQFYRVIGKCLRTDPNARPKSGRCYNLGASGLVNIIRTSYAKTAAVYKSAQAIKQYNSFDNNTAVDVEGKEKEEKNTDALLESGVETMNQLQYSPQLLPDEIYIDPPSGLPPGL